MSYQPADIYLSDTTPQENPILGVVVRVYSQDGAIFFTQVTTDGEGHVGLMLPAPATYQIRLYKFGVSLPNPTYLNVVDSPSNSFDISAEILTPPIPADARLCTAFGYFRRPDGSPADSVDIHFIPRFKPLLLDGAALLTERAVVRTNEKGYVEINLVRHGQYDVTVEGLEDYQRHISVPDLANINLPDLLFPVVTQVLFDPPLPATLGIGDDFQSTPKVIFSDGNEPKHGTTYAIRWSSSNDHILAVMTAGGVLTLRGIAAGGAQVQGIRSDRSIVRIPEPGILGLPFSVAVS